MSGGWDDIPRGRYGVILADPPWYFRSFTALTADNADGRRDAERHYSVMGIDAICALPVRDMAARDAHLFLWVTGPFLNRATDVMRAWGFRYSGVAFTWVKFRRGFNTNQLRIVASDDADLHVGLGRTTRKNAEFCLLGRRGNPRRNAKDVREIILAPVRKHSQKPDQAFDRIERYCSGPYLELFARTPRVNWDTFGNEIGGFVADAAPPLENAA